MAQALVDVSQIDNRIIAQRIDYLATLLGNIAGNGTTTGTGSVVLNNGPMLLNPVVASTNLLIAGDPGNTGPNYANGLLLQNTHGASNFKSFISFKDATSARFQMGIDPNGAGEQIFYLDDVTNTLVFFQYTAGTGTVINSALKLGSASTWTANGSTAISLTNIAPSGAHATVQEWLTIQDNNGTTRYIPCF